MDKSIASLLKKRRADAGLTVREVLDALKLRDIIISDKTLYAWEAGTRQPDADTFLVLCQIYGITKISEIIGENENSAPSAEALKVARNFDQLDDVSRSVIRAVIREEQARDAEPEPETKTIPLFGVPFAAGPGEPDTEAPWEDYEVPASSKAEFAVRISGDSMEPVLRDGQIALCVKRRPEIGEVAVVLVNGAFFVKQFITDGRNVYLRSLNRARKALDYDIWEGGSDTVKCFGTVILPKRPPLVEE